MTDLLQLQKDIFNSKKLLSGLNTGELIKLAKYAETPIGVCLSVDYLERFFEPLTKELANRLDNLF